MHGRTYGRPRSISFVEAHCDQTRESKEGPRKDSSWSATTAQVRALRSARAQGRDRCLPLTASSVAGFDGRGHVEPGVGRSAESAALVGEGPAAGAPARDAWQPVTPTHNRDTGMRAREYRASA